ncbi:MerR family transcriptional regulator [Cryobacterium sp. TMB1-7]|uniref:MerR family transcriptional regulator n=1 Tax=Cryobacterium sp. TMB1-7 TaxID=2555866 RepID=UPI001F53ED88|nr:MerR family transcriptional regulator [Cryobacterium sp. TMB1-7]
MDSLPAPLRKAPLIHSSLIPIPPRQVTIGDAASFVGTTPRAIRLYQEIGLLPEPERGSDDRRYGYGEIIRLLWIRKMADAGIAVDAIRDAFADPAPTGADSDYDVAGARELGLLPDFVTSRLTSLPEGSLRQADLDILLVTERIFGPLGAAVQAGRFIALATHRGLREESDRVDTAEEALDDMIAVDDPRVAQVAAEQHAFELALHAVIEDSGLAQEDDALFDSWDALHPVTDEDGAHESMSANEAIGMMPYDWSPARLRCMELAEEIAANESSAS